MSKNKQALRDKIQFKREILDTQTVIDVDELEALLDELEEVQELFFRAKALMYQSGGAPIERSLNPIDAWLYDAELAAGITVKGE